VSTLPQVERVVETRLPTRHGVFRMLGYRESSGQEHVALVMTRDDCAAPDRTAAKGAVPWVRLHSECLTGDALGSLRCDCGEQLDAALAMIAAHGHGALIYLRGHEGRGIGLVEKLRAYALQDLGADTVDANTRLGHPADARDYGAATAMLGDLGLHEVVLLSSNPAKQAALEAGDVVVRERRSLIVPERVENATYLATKRARMAHDDPSSDPIWRRLLKGVVPDTAGHPLERTLLERYGPLVAAGPDLVIAQLAQSIDGFIASRSGHAEYVSGPIDREHLHRLRALVDAVVVGGATVAADDCLLTTRAVEGNDPVRVVLDPRAQVPASARVLQDPAAPTLWLWGEGAVPSAGDQAQVGSHVEVVRLPLRDDGGFAPGRVVALLRERGLRRLLVEGGGRTVSAFLHAGALDRLYLTTAPMLIGDGIPGIRFDGTDRLSGALRPGVRRFVLGDDICTEFVLTDLGHGTATPVRRADPA
jgi:3,4-dihydroxy 2-butanone 4-phosphate synthase/GTP cyclohydrolase II